MIRIIIAYASAITVILFSSARLFAGNQTQPPSKDPKSTSSSPPSSGTTAPTGSGGKQSNILDFDADVIEGERSGPSIMVQMDLQAPNLDTLVFQRKNFNDFHVIDMKRKPKYRGQ